MLRFFFSSSLRPNRLWDTRHHFQWVSGILTLWVKWPGREADHLPPSSAEFNSWSYTSTPPVGFHDMVLNEARDKSSWRST
jgi:hypothetical protein